jgi:hypothetical protein
MTLSITTLRISIRAQHSAQPTLSSPKISVKYHYADYFYDKYTNALCRYTECYYAECHYDECYLASCH